MTKQAAVVKAVSCPNCGSPINLFGGHRVESIICPACNSCLDGRDEYKVIEQFIKMNRPNLPLKIGMVGMIKDIEFTVIGIVRWREEDDEGVYISYGIQIFSPTHGFAWLNRDDEFNYTFSRDVKDLPEGLGVSPGVGERFTAKGMKFTVQETGSETISYVEGELSWIAKLGDTSRYVTAYSAPYIYEISRSDAELEYSFGEYISAEAVYAAFGIDGTPIKASSTSDLKPDSQLVKSRKSAGRIFLMICLAITAALFIMGRGTVILDEKIPFAKYSDGGETKTFKVSKSGALMRIDLDCPVSNAWTYFSCSVMKDDTQYFTIGKEISYYYGSDWSEGSKSASAYFRLPDSGEYKLFIEADGGTGNSGTTMQRNNLRIIIRENVFITRYFIILTILMFLFSISVIKIIKAVKKFSDEHSD
jgi:uncharacterized protein DUF4178